MYTGKIITKPGMNLAAIYVSILLLGSKGRNQLDTE
ncbi:hypothetical protein SAMN04515668_4455 [Hymenobacter arizonensis]|uniref:Uncharacterized protein n=1 Tax=Hymenobacter arizonensis TaxID=1227077 RepID=A0A1I6BF23_HYMAR|nr:hypothetical protein SAMN04515668_4455 [Hymenobacter arizonensis]